MLDFADSVVIMMADSLAQIQTHAELVSDLTDMLADLLLILVEIQMSCVDQIMLASYLVVVMLVDRLLILHNQTGSQSNPVDMLIDSLLISADTQT